jgi:hypothetical protein
MKPSMAIAYAMKKRSKKMAEGGAVKEEKSGYEPMPKEMVKHNHMAMEEDDRDLDQHGEEEEGPEGAWMAKGGFIGSRQGPEHEEDMIGRIMKQRQHMYSKGGEIANDTPPMADGDDADYDYLAKHDGLEFSYTGKNSGDELGDEQEDHDRHDIVAKIMKSRGKKDRMPRPA